MDQKRILSIFRTKIPSTTGSLSGFSSTDELKPLMTRESDFNPYNPWLETSFESK
jgi:hypothetical protein